MRKSILEGIIRRRFFKIGHRNCAFAFCILLAKYLLVAAEVVLDDRGARQGLVDFHGRATRVGKNLCHVMCVCMCLWCCGRTCVRLYYVCVCVCVHACVCL
jgi:predicted DNA repair protein MutK